MPPVVSRGGFARHFGGPAMLAVASLLLAGCDSGERPGRSVEYAVQGLYSASLAPGSRYAIIGSIQHGGSLWDSSQHERLYNWNHQQGSYSNLVASAFSSDLQYAVTAGQQNLVLWQVASGQPHWFWTAPAGILDVDLTSAASFALLGLDNHSAIYFDIQNGGVRRTLYHQGRVRAVDVSDDGQFAVTGSDNNLAKLWNLETGELLHSMAHGNRVNTVALSPNSRWVFSAGQLDKAQLWNSGNGRIVHTLSGDEPFISQRYSYTAAVFSSNSDQLLTGNSAGTVQLWDVRKGSELRRWQVFKKDSFRPTSATVMAVAFAEDGYRAIASNGHINVLN